MSGKIKSTIELAMEKAAKLPKPTAEEIRRRREEEYQSRGGAIAERFLAGELSEGEVEIELGRHHGEEGEIARGAYLSALCRSIALEDAATLTRAFEGIGVLVRDDFLGEMAERLRGIFQDYEQQMQQELARTEASESASLRDLGVSGSAIRLDLRRSERWRERQDELLRRFRPKLDVLRRELGDHLLSRGQVPGGGGGRPT
jgi:hypothetical protein